MATCILGHPASSSMLNLNLLVYFPGISLCCSLSPPPYPHTLSLSLLHKSIKPFLSAQVKFQATWAGKPKKGKKKVIKKNQIGFNTLNIRHTIGAETADMLLTGNHSLITYITTPTPKWQPHRAVTKGAVFLRITGEHRRIISRETE